MNMKWHAGQFFLVTIKNRKDKNTCRSSSSCELIRKLLVQTCPVKQVNKKGKITGAVRRGWVTLKITSKHISTSHFPFIVFVQNLSPTKANFYFSKLHKKCRVCTILRATGRGYMLLPTETWFIVAQLPAGDKLTQQVSGSSIICC